MKNIFELNGAANDPEIVGDITSFPQGMEVFEHDVEHIVLTGELPDSLRIDAPPGADESERKTAKIINMDTYLALVYKSGASSGVADVNLQ